MKLRMGSHKKDHYLRDGVVPEREQYKSCSAGKLIERSKNSYLLFRNVSTVFKGEVKTRIKTMGGNCFK